MPISVVLDPRSRVKRAASLHRRVPHSRLARECFLAALGSFGCTATPGAAPEVPTLLVNATGFDSQGRNTVRTLDEAVTWASQRTDLTSVTIEVEPGLYIVRNPIRIGALPFPLTLRATAPGVRLVGGAAFSTRGEALLTTEPNALRFPVTSREQVRVLDLTRFFVGDARNIAIGLSPRGFGREPRAVESELFFAGTPLTLARWPNGALAPADEIADTGSIPRNRELDIDPRKRESGPERGGAFRVRDRIRARRWAKVNDLWAWGFWNHDWADELLPVKGFDPETGILRLAIPHRYGLDKGARYFVTNLPEELDAPGEYWIDRDRGVAYAWPPVNLDNSEDSTPEWILSTLGYPILTLDGASRVCIEGLTFEGSRGQAISARSVSEISIRNCMFRNLGTQGVVLEGSNCAVEACLFEDLGAGGVTLDGGDRATLTPARNEVVDSVFRRCARLLRTYQPAIRLSGVGQRVAHNSISDLPHFAISFDGNEHVIERNAIARVVLETGDAGAVYAGRDWTLHGTILRNNLFHDIDGSDARYQNAVYLDDMASGISVVDNVFLRCNWGVLAGGGRDLRIEGNVFVLCRKGVQFDARGTGWMAPALADPERSTLHSRYRAVPVDKEPWATRYPVLRSYLVDRFGRPAGSCVRGNVLVSTPLGNIADRDCVKVEDNDVVDAEWSVAELLASIERRVNEGQFGPRRGGAPGGPHPFRLTNNEPRKPTGTRSPRNVK